MKTKTKYVNHDGWPELKNRLEKEIMVYESFSFEPYPENLVDCFETLENFNLYSLPQHLRVAHCSWIYPILFKHYPVIKLKVSEAIFESWLLIHSVEELKQLIGYKENE